MTTSITSFFTDNGVPRTGLTPTITIRETDTSTIVVNAQACSEVGSGAYKYDFDFDANVDYSIFVDGGSILLDSERYQFSSIPDVRIVAGRIC